MDARHFQFSAEPSAETLPATGVGRAIAPTHAEPAEPEFLGWCLDCNYPLHHLGENRCPECGRPFSPEDKRTRNTEGPINAIGRFFLTPVGWTIPILAFLYLLACCWETRVPSEIIKFPFMSRYLGAVVWMAWMTRMMGRLSFRMRYQETDLVQKGGWGLAWTVPVIIALAYVLVGAGTPLSVGVWISATPMRHYAEEIMAHPTVSQPSRWVGVYETDGGSLLPSGYKGAKFAVKIEGLPFTDRHGFAYAPDQNLPADLPDGHYDRIAGPWYTWQEHR